MKPIDLSFLDMTAMLSGHSQVLIDYLKNPNAIDGDILLAHLRHMVDIGDHLAAGLHLLRQPAQGELPLDKAA